MVESVGKKLHQARLQRGLTIDEAAHATKLRPDKIAALEADDYSRFANNIYAKGFLQIYGRFLKVDVEDFARTLDNANPISISDYQYLTNAPVVKTETIAVRRNDERRPPSLAPLLVFVLFIALAIIGVVVYQRYEQVKASAATKSTTPAPEGTGMATPTKDSDFVNDPPPRAATPGPQAMTPAPRATPAVVPRIAPATPAGAPPLSATPAPVVGAVPRAITPAPAVGVPHAVTPAPLLANQRGTPAPLIGAATPRVAPPVALPGATPMVRPPEQDFVTPSPVASGDVPARPGGVNEVLVATVKKTWVTVRRDDPKAAPIFEDFVYPNAAPLKLRGARFFIDAKDPAAVQITKNGLPYAYQANGAPVQ